MSTVPSVKETVQRDKIGKKLYLLWNRQEPLYCCCGVSVNEYSCAHGAQINFGDLTPYLTFEYNTHNANDLLVDMHTIDTR